MTPGAPEAPAVPGKVERWYLGARPKTLPAAVVPVVVGMALAMTIGHRRSALYGWVGYAPLSGQPVLHLPPTTTLWIHWPDWLQQEFLQINWVNLVLTALLALALQIGVNYANDYSDGIKGTDEVRVGPLRLVGSGLVPARTVKLAAFGAFGVAGLCGLYLASQTSWWLVLVGAIAILSAWGYTGGPKPYGYLGLGELFVFLFFGLVATVGTAYIQLGWIPWQAWIAAVPVGLLACALLEGNNLRDVTGDTAAGKKTLAVRLGRARASWLYLGAIVGVVLGIIATAVAFGTSEVQPGFAVYAHHSGLGMPRRDLHLSEFLTFFNVHYGWRACWVLLGLLGLIGLLKIIKLVRSPAEGRALLPVLGATGKAQLRTGLLFALGLILMHCPLFFDGWTLTYPRL